MSGKREKNFADVSGILDFGRVALDLGLSAESQVDSRREQEFAYLGKMPIASRQVENTRVARSFFPQLALTTSCYFPVLTFPLLFPRTSY